MYVLDTNIIRYWAAQRARFPTLAAEIERTPNELLFITSISRVEVWRGAVLLVDETRKQNDDEALIHAFKLVEDFHDQLGRFRILPYDERAHEQYSKWKLSVRITKARHMDFRIAAIAVSRGFTVVTANTQHFEDVPGVRYEDWTR